MLTIHNFESQLDRAILKRGKQYYDEGNVTSIEEAGEGIWTAEVEGSDLYEVEVILSKGGKVSEASCDCLYDDDDICKHVVAVLYTIREEQKKPENKASRKQKKDLFEKLLHAVSLKEYQDFISTYAAKDKNFQTAFELFFAGKEDGIDVEKKYRELVQKLIRNHTDGGFIEYRATFVLSKEINELLKTGVEYTNKNNYRDALALARAVLRPLVEATTDCDDSNGSIGGSVSKAIDLLEAIATSPEAAINIKEQLLKFLQTELNDKVYFEMGDAGYDMFSVFRNLAVSLKQPQALLDFIDKQLSKLSSQSNNYTVEYNREYFQKQKIKLLQQTGKKEEAQKLVRQSMDIVQVREGEVSKALRKKDYVKAKELIEEGIKVAEKKGHPGTVSRWQQELLRIALLEKDTPAIRRYTKHFAFDRGFSTDYYRQWKKTFPAAQWKKEIEKHIDDTIKQVTQEWKGGKARFWNQTHPPLLEALGPIYLEEKYWDRLLHLVQQEGDLDTTLEYQPYLINSYPEELLAIYLPALEQLAQKASTRSEYKDLAGKMKKVMKDIPPGKERIVNLAKQLKEQYSSKPRRPAMMEELNKIL